MSNVKVKDVDIKHCLTCDTYSSKQNKCVLAGGFCVNPLVLKGGEK